MGRGGVVGSAEPVRRPAWEPSLWRLNQWKKVLGVQCFPSSSDCQLHGSRKFFPLHVQASSGDGGEPLWGAPILWSMGHRGGAHRNGEITVMAPPPPHKCIPLLSLSSGEWWWGHSMVWESHPSSSCVLTSLHHMKELLQWSPLVGVCGRYPNPLGFLYYYEITYRLSLHIKTKATKYGNSSK